MSNFADVCRALNAMQDEGIVKQYAIGGGTAALFYAETTRTYDVDVFVLIESASLIIDLSSIYNWARARGYEVRDEYLIVHNVPVQILVAGDGIQTEAVETANTLEYDGVSVRVMKPEYLAVLYVCAGGSKRRIRASVLLADNVFEEQRIRELLEKFGLTQKWLQNGGNDL